MAEKIVRQFGPLNAQSPDQPPNRHQITEGHIVDRPSVQKRPPHNQRSPARGPPSAATTEEIGAPVYMGAESLASALLDTLKSGQPPEDSQQSSSGGSNLQPSAHETMKLLYLADTGSMHPFANLWLPGSSAEDICLALPDDETFERCLTAFYDTVHLVLPSCSVDDFEADARAFWRERSSGQKRESELRSPSWLAVLFCILACGCTYSTLSRAESDLSSRVFVCCTFALLRLDNYLLQPTISSVRALVGLCGNLRDQANPAASWSLLGMAIRLAQSLSLHCAPPPRKDSPVIEQQAWTQGLVWQDTTLSLCYDRPCAAFVDGSIPRIPRSTNGIGLSYPESCHGLAIVMNDMCHEWTRFRRAGSASPPAVHFRVAEEQILLWEASAEEYLRNRAICRDNTQRLLQKAFQIFVNFFIFQLHRHLLTARPLFANSAQITPRSPETGEGNQDTAEDHNAICMDRCETILYLYLSMRKSHFQASRVWLLIHICISCSFFLATAMKKAKDQHGEDPKQDGDNSRYRILRDLAKHFEETIPYTIHPHHTDILNTLKDVIGLPA
ncbi:hypothetical protein G647_07373 [Cladophialophora carrionii CBS 160.54]|uniref:Xylanolytic transcriptional activator regulatory domain-containing protein n=1 Tax=Cladophialophora carrionii CBS 160.54 TaxID=1279043 RepID=V9D2C9_9EURO|nr:uncharacterized protein G647_07373 [Cladophialophora carrionii CBS 160.54]ETI21030.1 hypothetical protein G647_07373 [Cladophialophora carrionii CBS 160.54]